MSYRYMHASLYAHIHTCNCSKLVNKSVANTVDLRALTKISSSSSEDQKREALKDNMTLALESARAIGCRVSDDSSDNILNRHPQTIRDFLVDLIRVSQLLIECTV